LRCLFLAFAARLSKRGLAFALVARLGKRGLAFALVARLGKRGLAFALVARLGIAAGCAWAADAHVLVSTVGWVPVCVGGFSRASDRLDSAEMSGVRR
jgi:hypothetical protein